MDAVRETARTLVSDVKRRYGIETDAELARRLGVNPMQIHRVKMADELSPITLLVLRLLVEREEQVAA